MPPRPIPCGAFPSPSSSPSAKCFVGVSFIIPGTTLLVALGGVIGASHIGLFPAWPGAVLGSVLGDWISWWIGFHYHHKIVHFRLFRRFEDQIEKALHLFHNWGTWAIFIGRFMGPFRATVPLVAGMSELEFWPFMIANVDLCRDLGRGDPGLPRLDRALFRRHRAGLSGGLASPVLAMLCRHRAAQLFFSNQPLALH